MLFSFSYPIREAEVFYREASTIKAFAFLKFDVAKLEQQTNENKKTASTTTLYKPLSTSILQNPTLYNREIKEKVEGDTIRGMSLQVPCVNS